MLKFTVTGQVETVNYTDKKGQAASFVKQVAYAHVVNADGTVPPFPEKFSFIVARGEAPYAPGEYTLHPSALYVDRDGRLACNPRLTPAKRAA